MDGNGTYGFTSIWGLDRDMSMSELNKIFEPGCPKCLKKKDILDYWVWHKLLLLERFSERPSFKRMIYAFFCLKDENDGWNDRTIRGTAAANMKKGKMSARGVTDIFFVCHKLNIPSDYDRKAVKKIAEVRR